ALPGRSGRVHAGGGLGERAGREPGRQYPRALVYAAANLSRGGALDCFVEEVVGCVRHQSHHADGTGGRWREPSNSVQPLDVSSLRQLVAAGWSVLGSNHLQQVPGNRTRLDGDGGNRPGPDLARILRVLPRGAGQAILKRGGGLL